MKKKIENRNLGWVISIQFRLSKSIEISIIVTSLLGIYYRASKNFWTSISFQDLKICSY